MTTRPQGRGSRFSVLGAVCILLFAGASRAQSTSPAAALRTWNPQLFAPGTVADAAAGGTTGARIVQLTDALNRLGFRVGDVVVAVEGRVFAQGAPTTRGTDAVYTVIRSVPGERPVLTPEIIGIQVLDQFADLDPAARTPMRLARMLANQQTLVREGFGIVLVPAAANENDGEWLRVANPLPSTSESALRDVADAVRERTTLSSSGSNEGDDARRALESEEYFEARERAARALLDHVLEPGDRGDRAPVDTYVRVFREASRGVESERRILMATGRRFGVYALAAFHHVKENLPQNTLLLLDGGANNVAITAGLRTALFWPSEGGGWPVWRDMHLLTSYSYSRHTFEGPPEQAQPGSEPRMRTSSHRVSAELVYQPRVLSRLRPHFRGGPAAFYITAGAYDTEDRLRDRVQNWELGWILGGGIDAYYNKKYRFRVTVTADYQIVSTTFCDREAENWIDATNIIELDQIARPRRPSCGPDPGDPFVDAPYYEVDLEGFQVGLAFSYDF